MPAYRGFRGYKGQYTPLNPQKYKGNVRNIIYRSLLERRMMLYLDTSPSVKCWSSEECIIHYFSPVHKRVRRYFPDFYAEMDTKAGPKTYVIEVKPTVQTKPPVKKTKKVTKSYLFEAATWVTNKAKWKAAEELCAKRGWQFKIVTEKDIGMIYG